MGKISVKCKDKVLGTEIITENAAASKSQTSADNASSKTSEDNKIIELVKFTKVTLNEYISKPYKAVLECEVMQISDLIKNTSSYIGEYISIKLEQTINKNIEDSSTKEYSYHRYISGVITNITYKGLISENKDTSDKNTYLYEIVVQPPFAQMMRKKKTKSYENKSVKEIIEDILNKNLIKDYDTSGIKEEDNIMKHSKNIIFHQNNATDYNFLMKLCTYYGINYYFKHLSHDVINNTSKEANANNSSSQKISSDKQLDTTTIKFISGKLPRGQFMDITNNDKVINTLQNAEDSRYETGIFYSGVTINYTNEIISIDDSDISLNGFEYGDNAEALNTKKSDITLFKDNLNASLSYMKNTIQVYSPYINAGVNSYLTLNGYKPGDNISDELHLIKSETIFYNGKNDKDMISITGFVDNNNESSKKNVNFGIIRDDIENAVTRYNININVLIDDNKSSKDNTPTEDTSKEDTPKEEENKTYQDLLISAVVCDSDNKIDKEGISIPDNTNQTNPSTFYALLNDNSTKVTVNIVVPYGAKNYYLYTYPEIGSHVLLLHINDKYYLYGYTPDISQLISEQDEMTNSSMFIGTPHNNYINIIGSRMIKDRIYDGTIDSFMSEAYSYIDILSIKDDYENNKAAHTVNKASSTISIKEWCHELKSKYSDNIKAKQDKMKNMKNTADTDSLQKEINQCDKNIKTIAEEITQAASEINNIFDKAKTSIDSIGSLSSKDKELKKSKIKEYLKRNNVIDIKADSVEVSADDTDIKALKQLNLFSNDNGIEISSKDDTINIKANKAIKFMVGTNYIMINEDNIVLSSQTKGHSLGPADSSITLNSSAGTTISGVICSINSIFSSTITDGFGGSVSTKAGSAQLSGIKVSLDSYAIPSMVTTGKNVVNYLSAFFSDSTVLKDVMNGISAFSDVVLGIDKVYKSAQKYRDIQNKTSDKAFHIIDILFTILEMIATVLDKTAAIMETEQKDKKKIREIRTTVLCIKLSIFVATYMTIIIKLAITDKYSFLSPGNFSIIGGQIKCFSGKIEQTSIEAIEANTLGKPTKDTQQRPDESHEDTQQRPDESHEDTQHRQDGPHEENPQQEQQVQNQPIQQNGPGEPAAPSTANTNGDSAPSETAAANTTETSPNNHSTSAKVGASIASGAAFLGAGTIAGVVIKSEVDKKNDKNDKDDKDDKEHK